MESSNQYWNTLAILTGRLRLIVTIVCFVVLAIAFVTGCGPRVVLVTEDSPVRAGSDMKGHVYALVNGTWTPSGNKVSVPEGWYFVPPSFVENNE